MIDRRRSKRQNFGWLSAFIFNILFVSAALTVCLIIFEVRRTQAAEFNTSGDALTATQKKMGVMFVNLIPEDTNRRDFWAEKIETELRENDLVSARGFLLAAPYMLDNKDAAAVSAAASTDTIAPLDDRLLNAAKLFLPDNVRALYERSVAPSRPDIDLEQSDIPDASAAGTEPVSAEAQAIPAAPESIGTDAAENIHEETSTPEPTDVILSPATELTTADKSHDFFVLGNERDLAYQSAGWVRGDKTDVLALSLSGLGLIAAEQLIGDEPFDDRFFHGASLVKSARRARRLKPDFAEYLEARLDDALPAETLRINLNRAFAGNANLLIQGDIILEAFASTVDEDHLAPLYSDMLRIGALSSGRPDSAAMTILETVNSPRDMLRAELIAFAGGDRAVTLSKYYGNDALDAATTITDWTMRLIQLIILLIALILILLWITVATLFRSFNVSGKQSRSYRYS